MFHLDAHLRMRSHRRKFGAVHGVSPHVGVVVNVGYWHHVDPAIAEATDACDHLGVQQILDLPVGQLTEHAGLRSRLNRQSNDHQRGR